MSKAKTATNSVVEIKNYPASLIRNHKSEDGDEFSTLSFKWHDRWCSCILSAGAISQSTTRKGKSIDGRLNVTLGDPEQVRNISILEDDNTYKRKAMFNRSILSAITENRQEYLRSIAV